MATKKSKTTNKTSKSSKYNAKHIFCHPSTWIAATLALALLVVYGVSMYGFKHVDTKTDLEIAKLELFDSLIQDSLSAVQVNSEKPSINKATGYGVSDEDGTFYVTFDYTTYNIDEEQNATPDETKHAIMYFWKDKERGTYSHAFSYHDDDYHPGGTYVKLEN
ncbi:hypothetical protein IKE99_01240 [Candidatus Saccharibacteria bacterium]|nr:hypothetical protein [Candidatus Saccharibacteria bacterium]